MSLSQTSPVPAPLSAAPRTAWRAEFGSTLRIAWPLIAAQLAQMLILTTDVVMIGRLGPRELAAATLAVAVLHPFLLFGVGIATACAPMIAQALGQRDLRSVRRSVRQGFWASGLAFAVLLPLVLSVETVLMRTGQAPETAALVGDFLSSGVFLILPSLLFIVTRSFLAAHGHTGTIFAITVLCIGLNALGLWLLVLGPFGLPQLGLFGAGIASSVTNAAMFALSLAAILARRRYRRYGLFVRFWKPDWPRLARILAIGVPIGATLAAETGMFAGAAVMMGWLGTEALAGHAAALQWAALAFMVPLGLGQATTVRVGLAQGQGDRTGVGRAGWTSIGLGMGFMSMTALVFLAVPEPLVGLFLHGDAAAIERPLALAVTYLSVAALFALADGAQVVGGSALRGLGDTAWPMVAAIGGYWAVGLPLAYLLGFPLGLEGVGVWLGLACGLASVAAMLLLRFAFRERLGLLDRRLG
jgi:multidrug resistance protein, MATE family